MGSVHASGANVDPDTQHLYTNFDDTASPEGCVDTSNYKGSDRLKNRVAIVTGGTQAIGKTCVEVLAKEGAIVYFCGRRAELGERLQENLRKELKQGKVGEGAQGEERVFFDVADVADEDSLKSWIDSVGEKEGKIDIVLPNAAAFVFGTVDEVTSSDWDVILNTNVKGYANCVKFALPYLRSTQPKIQRSGSASVNQNRVGGSVVMMASISSHVAQPSFVPYNTSKGAIIQMMRCMSLDLGPERIRVNAVCPGTIDTPATSKHATKLNITKAELTRMQCKGHFVKRLGATLDCAYAALFLASDESSFITGTSLMVDGGYTVGHNADE
jgi:NAD(P)-dependent dehydrogenase (short-subunit alcohol dehydrogenase family)